MVASGSNLRWWCFSLSRWHKDFPCTCGGFTHCNLRRWCFSSTHRRRYQMYTQATCTLWWYNSNNTCTCIICYRHAILECNTVRVLVCVTGGSKGCTLMAGTLILLHCLVLHADVTLLIPTAISIKPIIVPTHPHAVRLYCILSLLTVILHNGDDASR